MDRALGPDPAGQADAVITGPRADVGHGGAAGDLEGVEHRLGLLLLDPGLAEEPVGTLPRHHVGDRPAHVEAGRIAAGLGPRSCPGLLRPGPVGSGAWASARPARRRRLPGRGVPRRLASGTAGSASERVAEIASEASAWRAPRIVVEPRTGARGLSRGRFTQSAKA